MHRENVSMTQTPPHNGAEPGRLEGRVAIVTGGGQGIGRAIALQLAQDGARLVMADINQKGCLETAEMIADQYGRASLAVDTDVSDQDQVAQMVAKAKALTGNIDILVNNSGIAGPTAFAEDISLQDWEKTLAINLRGVFLCCKHVLPLMKAQKQGCIVNISSVAAKRPLVQRTPYGASKMGLIGFTRSLAAEAGAWGIRANTVCPGTVAGPRIEAVVEALSRSTGQSAGELLAQKAQASPLKRLVQPQEVAAVVAFLCSDQARAMTGQDINVSAGSVMY